MIVLVEKEEALHTLNAEFGQNLRALLLKNDLSPYPRFYKVGLNCHGLNICGLCKIQVEEEGRWIDNRSCQIRCYKDIKVRILP